MDINKLLKGIHCDCGHEHACAIEHVYIEKDAMGRLGLICQSYASVLIVADENTFAAAGENTLLALQDKHVKEVIFDGRNILVPNEDAICKVTEKLEGIDLIVGIGSGVIQDLCKYVAFCNQLLYGRQIVLTVGCSL